MSATDINKIFFGLIHYIFSEQKNVDWILKSSLVNFTGINNTLDMSKYEKNSMTEDIIKYIYQVKPYHVQFEQFIEKYSSQTDQADVLAKENYTYEVKMRFDAVTSEVDKEVKDFTRNNIEALKDLENVRNPIRELINNYVETHMANRLWIYKYANFMELYNNEEEIQKYITDVMNCHFKGLTVDGYEFDIETMGYDAFLYDSNLYDSPTITSDYCLVDMNENITYPYIKTLVKVGAKSFQLDSEEELIEGNLKVYSLYNGEQTEIKDYQIEKNVITFKKPIKSKEKIIIENRKNDYPQNYFYLYAYPFSESNDESNLRQIVDCTTTRFLIPDGDITGKKIIVHIQYPNGSRYVCENYKRDGKYIILDNGLEEDYHVILTTIDYRGIYDRIFTYEDCYGQSNNIQLLDGNDFLRPYYEAERPSQLCVSHPIQNLMCYTYINEEKAHSCFNMDFKNEQMELPINSTMSTKLTKDLIIGDKTIEVEDISKIVKPYVDDKGINKPGNLLINSEIIEFFEYEQLEGKKGLLKSIRRGANGSYLAEKHNENSIVYSYSENNIKHMPTKTEGKNVIITEDTENNFEIPNGYTGPNNLVVYKKPIINLLTDITFKSKYFDLDDNGFEMPTEDKLGFIRINDDIVYFSKIKEYDKNDKTYYRISDFHIDKEYKKEESVIVSTKAILQKGTYSTDTENGTITFYEKPKVGEIIILNNIK